MEINSFIIINIIIILLQFFISLTKYRHLGLILIIISSIIFLIFKHENFYNLALTQSIIFILMFIIHKLFEISLNKKRNKEIEIMKIKDL